MTISLLDVIKYFANEPHQIESVQWLQANIAPDTLKQFEAMWRSLEPELLSASQLHGICPDVTIEMLNPYAIALNKSFVKFGMTSKIRIAHFIAQVAHESDGFNTTEEYASGEEYEGRTDLGNTDVGDGLRYKGSGLIELTGRYNYEKCGKALGVDLIANPQLLRELPLCVDSAFWFWNTNELNQYADADDIETITRIINGGLNGFESRQEYLARAKHELGIR